MSIVPWGAASPRASSLSPASSFSVFGDILQGSSRQRRYETGLVMADSSPSPRRHGTLSVAPPAPAREEQPAAVHGSVSSPIAEGPTSAISGSVVVSRAFTDELSSPTTIRVHRTLGRREVRRYVGTVPNVTLTNDIVTPTPSAPRCMRVDKVQPASAEEAPLVLIVGPGSGQLANKPVFDDLSKDGSLKVQVVGQSRGSYDRYPAKWPGGSPAPNLESFAEHVISQGVVDQSQCVVVGSRGGQVVLPTFWQTLGDASPPAVVINGGCAGSLPTPVEWPQAVVSIILLGGQDYFGGGMADDEYVATAKSNVPKGNTTTAIFHVREMMHMPQSKLLGLVLRPMIEAAMRWKRSGLTPESEFHQIGQSLEAGGWSGQLCFTGSFKAWEGRRFGRRVQQNAEVLHCATRTTRRLAVQKPVDLDVFGEEVCRKQLKSEHVESQSGHEAQGVPAMAMAHQNAHGGKPRYFPLQRSLAAPSHRPAWGSPRVLVRSSTMTACKSIGNTSPLSKPSSDVPVSARSD